MPRDDITTKGKTDRAVTSSFGPSDRERWDENLPHTEQDGLDLISSGHAGVVLTENTEPTDPAEGQVWLDGTDTTTPELAIDTITISTLLDSSYTVVLCDASGGAFVVSLPAAADRAGENYHIKKIDVTSNAITVDPDGSETIDDETTKVISIQHNSMRIVSDGTQWRII